MEILLEIWYSQFLRHFHVDRDEENVAVLLTNLSHFTHSIRNSINVYLVLLQTNENRERQKKKSNRKINTKH